MDRTERRQGEVASGTLGPGFATWQQAADYWQRMAEADQLEATQEVHEATLHQRLALREPPMNSTPGRVVSLRKQLAQALLESAAERMERAQVRLKRAAAMRQQQTVTPSEG